MGSNCFKAKPDTTVSNSVTQMFKKKCCKQNNQTWDDFFNDSLQKMPNLATTSVNTERQWHVFNKDVARIDQSERYTCTHRGKYMYTLFTNTVKSQHRLNSLPW